MKRRALLAAGVLVSAQLCGAQSGLAFELNYDELITLDAENLAETGVKSAYEKLRPALMKYLSSPAEVHERVDHDIPSYAVSCLGTEYQIFGKNDQDESWGKATFALFDLVNRQLAKTPYRFFAINDGNGLGGMFLALDEAESAKKSLPRKADWPYLPSLKKPWYGQYR
jgi:hypothetical protein